MTFAADQRKSNAVAAARAHAPEGAIMIRDYAAAREVLRSGSARQAGAGADLITTDDLDQVSMFYLDGEPHRAKRAAVARYFSLKAIETRYAPIIARTTEALVAQLIEAGRCDLDGMSFRLAVAVTAEILGLDYADLDALAARIEATLATSEADVPLRTAGDSAVDAFFAADVAPAIHRRRAEPGDDVITRLVEQGWSDSAILTEVMAYAVGGMLTTREFIVMAAWHFFDQPDLRDAYLAGDEQRQLAILAEVLRLEPVAAILTRRIVEDIEIADGRTLPAGALVAIDIRATNYDEAAAGGCPFAIRSDREDTTRAAVGFMSFGDGPHRCPGAQLALHEACGFLDRLFRIPSLKLERAPLIDWYDPIHSYELRGAMVAV